MTLFIFTVHISSSLRKAGWVGLRVKTLSDGQNKKDGARVLTHFKRGEAKWGCVVLSSE
jgi:hypothetical protein